MQDVLVAGVSVSNQGMVEAVRPREIIGTVHVPAQDESVRVTLFVNDVEVHSIDVPRAVGGSSVFRFPVKDLWLYCGRDDQVTVRAPDGCLPMPDGSLHHTPASPRRRPLDELVDRLRTGEIVNSHGSLVLPKYRDEDWQRSASALYHELSEAIQQLTGYDIFLVYGSLLGAVREGRPLGHDLDFDVAYMSEHTDRELVVEEAVEVALALQEQGFSVVAKASCLMISNEERTQAIDLYYYSFTDDGDLRLVLGAAGAIPFRVEQWRGTEEVEFAGSTVRIPRNAEALVTTLYGATWRIPNPGFSWSRERTWRNLDAAFPLELRPGINWQDHWQHPPPSAVSSFAKRVVKLRLNPQLVVDLGCGDGHDATAFVRARSRVLGLDYTPSAIEAAHRRGLSPDDARFVLCDLEDEATLRDAVRAHRGATHVTLFYGRHLLDSVSEDLQWRLLKESMSLCTRGDAVALEFRTPEDTTLTAHEKRSCGRRLVDPTPVRELLKAGGFEIILDQGGAGWERRGRRGMHLHRIVAIKPRWRDVPRRYARVIYRRAVPRSLRPPMARVRRGVTSMRSSLGLSREASQ